MMILSAKFNSPKNDSVIIQTDERGSVFIPLTGEDNSGWREDYLKWNGETSAYVAPIVTKTVRQILEEAGYDGIARDVLKDIQDQLIAAQIPLPTKATAVRAWITQLTIAHATGLPLPPAPHYYSEILEELLPYTQ